MRVDYALRQHEQWYKGDGVYGDGPAFHWDYYNSFVIQPMLLDVLDVVPGRDAGVEGARGRVEPRARRYAAILERLIAPDGTFPPIGRSIAYRFGAFQLLAQMALRKALPEECRRRRCAARSTAIIRRSIEAPGTFDANGWLQIGFCGHQPGVGETYISTGSLYLCAVGLLPLGLPPARSVLVGARRAVDVGARLVRPAVSDRPRARDADGRAARAQSSSPSVSMSTMMSASSSCCRSALRMNPAGRFFEPGCRIHACSSICM